MHFAIQFDEPAWPDLPDQTPFCTGEAGTLLVGGMQSGKSSVGIRARNPSDGTEVVVQMSLDMLETFVRACRGREEHLRGLSGGEL